MFPLTINGQQYLNKDFNDLSLTSDGWTTQIIIDTTNWFVESLGGDDFVKITNYNNGNVPANTWYISPALNLSSSIQPLLSFETIMKWPGPALILHISTDYDGISNPTQQGTWTDITSQALWDTDNTTWGNWTPSGDVDLTSYISDSTFIAYEYIGSSNSGSTWEIDNIKINEGSAPPYCFSSDSIYQSICYGDSLLINGSYQFIGGYFNDTLFLADVNGCDSIVTTVLSFLNPVTAYNDTVFLSGCDSILWKGKIYTVSGNYYDTIYSGAVNGCDSLIPLYLTINNCSSNESDLTITSVMDFRSSFFSGTCKAILFTANQTISDLSVYGYGSANNGTGTDGQEYTFPNISIDSGQHVVACSDSSELSNYFNGCLEHFPGAIYPTLILIGSNYGNGNDAYELFENGLVIETFGEITHSYGANYSSVPWGYRNSWAWKDTAVLNLGNWIYGGYNCVDNTTTTQSSNCPFPLCGSGPPVVTYNVTLEVNTASIYQNGGTVGPNGMYAGGGFVGNAMGLQLTQSTTDTLKWFGNATVIAGSGPNHYTFLNSPANGGDWNAKENLAGLPCGDPTNYNDRLLPNIFSDTTIQHCFGTCAYDGTCNSVVNPPYCFSSDSIYQSICYGDSLLINGSYQFIGGYFNDTLFLADVNGCDSIVTTVLSFLNPVTAYNDTVFLSGCDSILWKGKIYTVSGNYYDTIYSGAVNGCDSLIPLYLTINNCSTCNTVYYSDTLNTFVSDTLFQSISPQLYFIYSDTFPQVSNPNCDSVVEIWREYVYYPNYCSDTITYYDTTYISISVSDTLYIDITVTGVTNISNTLSVYPNPASGVVIIDNGNYSTMSNYSLVIINSLSQQVFSSQINTQQFQIPVSTLGAEGTYFIQIFDGNNNLVIIKYLVLN